MLLRHRDRFVVHFLRHGQATHNVRAEPLRAAGCSFDAFLEQMRIDDEVDSELTQRGREQAAEVAATPLAAAVRDSQCWVVSSPHVRAIDTADVVLGKGSGGVRVLREEWREISGYLDNARRRSRPEIAARYADGRWDTSQIPSEDELWTLELEEKLPCATRAHAGLMWLWENVEGDSVAVAAHGGIFSYMTAGLHPLITAAPEMGARFHNCQLRSSVVTAKVVEGDQVCFHLGVE
mmetsp:Transcript_23377/g.61389  ORF Transcript_23377/g.61389 Transcript_23377/m.61389 type:complete len:236 (-) Transcript_23377:247-954(-)